MMMKDINIQIFKTNLLHYSKILFKLKISYSIRVFLIFTFLIVLNPSHLKDYTNGLLKRSANSHTHIFPKIAYAQEFISGFEDVPRMPGLIVDTNAVLVFDSAAGRIAEAYATGAFKWQDFTKFYKDSLRQLGWRIIGNATVEEHSISFSRENERLVLDRFGVDGSLTVRFTLSPTS